MADLPVRPARKTIQQTAIILNVSVRTVWRLLERGDLRKSGNQVDMDSISEYLDLLRSEEGIETVEEVEEKLKQTMPLSRPRRSGGWVKDF